MNNKIVTAIIMVAFIVLGGYFLLKSSVYQTPSSDLPSQTLSQEAELPSGEENVVTYTDGYSPNSLLVKVGTTITSKNNSSQSMWTASAVHPTHTAYPTTSGCIGSTFDACKGVQQDDSWSFTFDETGSWKYHNHLNPRDTGTIIVE